MNQPRYAIHRFPRSVQLVARMIQPRYVPHDFVHQDARYDPRSTHARYIIYPLSGIHNFVQQVARYDARMNHTRNEIKCGDFCVCFFKQHIINHQERYSFRATSCTLRCTTEPRTERYLTFADIHNFVQQVARYDL